MKLLTILFLVASCSTMSDGAYKKKYHVADFKSAESFEVTHALLKEKMTKCYPQSGYPSYAKTVAKVRPDTKTGEIAYEIDNQSLGPRPLLIVEVLSQDEGSLVKVYSKGEIFHPAGVYEHQVQKWIDGKKVDCGAFGQI